MGVSAAGIIAPFLFAALITPFLPDVPGLFTEGLSQGSATLFMGACIALTDFPMLARIINERGLADTALGTLTLTAGEFDDAARSEERRVGKECGSRCRSQWSRCT